MLTKLNQKLQTQRRCVLSIARVSLNSRAIKSIKQQTNNGRHTHTTNSTHLKFRCKSDSICFGSLGLLDDNIEATWAAHDDDDDGSCNFRSARSARRWRPGRPASAPCGPFGKNESDEPRKRIKLIHLVFRPGANVAPSAIERN